MRQTPPALLLLLGGFLTAGGALTGCRNACQQVCVEMRSYAEECGFTVEDEQFTTCIDEQKRSSIRTYLEEKYGDEAPRVSERVDVCSEALPGLREDWGCDDVELYFSSQSGSTSSDTGSGG